MTFESTAVDESSQEKVEIHNCVGILTEKYKKSVSAFGAQ